MIDSAAVLSGDRRALARAATAVENGTERGQALLREISPQAGKALIVGITGPPGAGKSTLVAQLVRVLRSERKRVAVIAVDPSSPLTGGALLGDRIRMQEHHEDEGVFVRSMATRGWPGGLSKTTREVVTLLDAAGFDVILIETVGVGQSEVDVARLAQVTVLVLVPGAGDDVQSIKAGIMEIAQVFAINKSDMAGAETLASQIHTATALESGTPPEIVKVTALDGSGVSDLWAAIQRAPRRTLPALS